MNGTTPAVIYADAATFARGREHAAKQYAANITNPPQCPGERGLLEDLLHGRRAAARMEAQVWREYAEEMERRFIDAADAEMQQADRTEARPAPGVYSPGQGSFGTVTRNALGEVVTPRQSTPHICTARNCRTCQP